mmetsp:Transcript_38980/g.93807  ORF Transcript_38980/g.93807 Transcript_38980/m.93807 type:complete len:243 (-) Transcript_38980:733-1461(-)
MCAIRMRLVVLLVLEPRVCGGSRGVHGMILGVILKPDHSAKIWKDGFPDDATILAAEHGHDSIARLDIFRGVLIAKISRCEDVGVKGVNSNINDLGILVTLGVANNPISNPGSGIGVNHKTIIHAGMAASILRIRMELIGIVGHSRDGIFNVGIPNGRGGSVLQHGGEVAGEVARDCQDILIHSNTGSFVKSITLPGEDRKRLACRCVDLCHSHLVLAPCAPRILLGALQGGITLHVDAHRF